MQNVVVVVRAEAVLDHDLVTRQETLDIKRKRPRERWIGRRSVGNEDRDHK